MISTLPCPFCGSADVGLRMNYDLVDGTPVGAVECDPCGSHGPVVRDQSESDLGFDLWDSRGGPEQNFSFIFRGFRSPWDDAPEPKRRSSDARRCPFCNSSDLGIHSVKVVGKVFYISCNNCDASGPLWHRDDRTISGAMKAWNGNVRVSER